MAKLMLRKSCYEGVPNVKEKIITYSNEHETLMKEANKRIEQRKIQEAMAYKNAKSYLAK